MQGIGSRVLVAPALCSGERIEDVPMFQGPWIYAQNFSHHAASEGLEFVQACSKPAAKEAATIVSLFNYYRGSRGKKAALVALCSRLWLGKALLMPGIRCLAVTTLSALEAANPENLSISRARGKRSSTDCTMLRCELLM